MYFTKMNCNQVEVLFFEAPSKNRPIIYTLHNGGLMFGSALTDAMMCHRLRNELDLNVVGIEYSLTTSAYYPTQLNEIETVMNYFYEHQEESDPLHADHRPDACCHRRVTYSNYDADKRAFNRRKSSQIGRAHV